MKPVGKTYLISVQKAKQQIVGGIYIPAFGDPTKMAYFIGTIIEYGTGFTSEEEKQLIPIGTKVIMDYTKNASKTMLVFGEKIYYIYNPSGILAIIQEQEED